MKSSKLPGPLLWLALFLLLLLVACNSSEEPADPLAAQGKRVFNRNCASCHSLKPDRATRGPSLAGIASRTETRLTEGDVQAYLRQSITDPSAVIAEDFSDLMPSDFIKKLDTEELNAVIAYLMTLE